MWPEFDCYTNTMNKMNLGVDTTGDIGSACYDDVMGGMIKIIHNPDAAGKMT